MLEPIPCSLNPSLLLIQPILAPKIHISLHFSLLRLFFVAFQPFPSCSLNFVTESLPTSQPIPLVPSTHLYYFLNPSLLLPQPIALLHQLTSRGPSTHLSFSLTHLCCTFIPSFLFPPCPPCFLLSLLLLHPISCSLNLPLASSCYSSCSSSLFLVFPQPISIDL